MEKRATYPPSASCSNMIHSRHSLQEPIKAADVLLTTKLLHLPKQPAAFFISLAEKGDGDMI